VPYGRVDVFMCRPSASTLDINLSLDHFISTDLQNGTTTIIRKGWIICIFIINVRFISDL